MADSAVVLGPGGPVGTAWLAGLAGGLRHEGVDLGAADLIVGTSAGAIVGAILASGGDPGRLAAPPAPADPAGGVRADLDALAEVLATLSDPGLERGEALRRVGRLALTASTGSQELAIARMRFLVGTAEWPDRPLLIPSVDAETGEPVIWDRHGAASLPQAVAASTAFPATAPPITIYGRRYIDGALRAGTNADLAAGARVVIVASLSPWHISTAPAAPRRAQHGSSGWPPTPTRSRRSVRISPTSPPGFPHIRPASGRLPARPSVSGHAPRPSDTLAQPDADRGDTDRAPGTRLAELLAHDAGQHAKK